VIGLKGDKESQFRKFGIDMPIFKHAKERTQLYLLDVNHVKDIISANIDLKWLPNSTEVQPPGYMNFPEPSQGMYLYNNYFSHYEAEERKIESKEGEGIASRWVKTKSNAQNHHFDVFVYSYCLREIWADLCLKAAKPPLKGNWYDFINYMRINKYL
jgi:hypothetical protein